MSSLLDSQQNLQGRDGKRGRDEDMTSALDAVKRGNMTLTEWFCVPCQTLGDRVSGRVVHGTRPGPKPYLTREKGNKFAEFLVETSKAGYRKGRKQVINIAENVAQDNGILGTDIKLSNGWYYHFMERQDDLKYVQLLMF